MVARASCHASWPCEPARAELGEQGARHAERLVAVAADDAHQREVAVVGIVRFACGGPAGAVRSRRGERVEPVADLGGGQPIMVEALERPELVGTGLRAARRHHRLLVPTQQRGGPVDVGELAEPLAQRSDRRARLGGVDVRSVVGHRDQRA